MAVPAPRFDAFGAALIADALGNARTVVAVREPSGRLRLKAGDALGVAEGTFGAQLAVGDLDQDGAPEIATSADLPAAGAQTARLDDAIDIATWSPGPPGAAASPGSRLRGFRRPWVGRHAHVCPRPDLRSRFHLAAPGGVRALAMCPPGVHGEPSLVAVVGGEVWTVRAGVTAAGPAPRSRRRSRDDRPQALPRGIGGRAGVPRGAPVEGSRPHAVRLQPGAARALARGLARPAPHRRRDGRVLR